MPCSNKNVLNKPSCSTTTSGDITGNITGDVSGNIYTDNIFELTSGAGLNIDCGVLYSDSGSLTLTQNPLINANKVIVNSTRAQLVHSINTHIQANSADYELYSVGMGNLSAFGHMNIESIDDDVDIIGSGNVNVQADNVYVNNASFGGIADTFSSFLTTFNGTNLNVETSSVDFGSGTSVSFDTNSTVDFESGSSVDFTGAVITGLSSGGLNVDAGNINISSTGTSTVSSLSFSPKLLIFNWRSNTKTSTSSSEARSGWGWYVASLKQFLCFSWVDSSGNLKNSTETAYCYGTSDLSSETILGTVSSLNSNGFELNTTVFTGFSSENFRYIAIG